MRKAHNLLFNKYNGTAEYKPKRLVINPIYRNKTILMFKKSNLQTQICYTCLK